jgi:hypothetical protein
LLRTTFFLSLASFLFPDFTDCSSFVPLWVPPHPIETKGPKAEWPIRRPASSLPVRPRPGSTRSETYEGLGAALCFLECLGDISKSLAHSISEDQQSRACPRESLLLLFASGPLNTPLLPFSLPSGHAQTSLPQRQRAAVWKKSESLCSHSAVP